MKNNKIMNLVKKAEMFGKERQASILTGMALIGLGVTVYKAYKAGPKIKAILDEKKKDLADTDPDDKATKSQVIKEAVKEITPIAAPVIIMTVATGACIVGSNTVSSKKIAVLTAGYKVAEKTANDLNDKMNEILGEKKARSIKDAIVKDGLKKDGPVDESKIILTGNGEVLCKDVYSGRYFRSNAQKLGQAINQLSMDCIQENYVELNDLYDLIGIPQIPLGSDFGWNTDDLVQGTLPITFSAQLTEDGQPCLCLDYDVNPRADFRNLH